MKQQDTSVATQPWWKYGHVWLIISGPFLVVVAALVTAWLAARSPDPVLAEDYYRRGVELSKVHAADKAMMPALQGRNHAVTPAKAGP
jgi:hypothetical protein